jgi:cold-inducible RNA-binding protein
LAFAQIIFYMKLFVGNLSFDTTETELEELFAPFGAVAEATVITDRSTGRSRGFGFVTLNSMAEAQAAIRDLAGKNFSGRKLIVNEAKPREEPSRRSFFGSRR